jgi:hypothetical protein
MKTSSYGLDIRIVRDGAKWLWAVEIIFAGVNHPGLSAEENRTTFGTFGWTG